MHYVIVDNKSVWWNCKPTKGSKKFDKTSDDNF